MIDAVVLAVMSGAIGLLAGWVLKPAQKSTRALMSASDELIDLKNEQIADMHKLVNTMKGKMSARELPPELSEGAGLDEIASAIGVKIPSFARPIVNSAFEGLIRSYKTDPAVKEKVDDMVKSLVSGTARGAKAAKSSDIIT